jgi:hypothetical protein
MTATNKASREEHAARINEAWQKGVDAVVETGLRVIDARDGLGHGEYIAMVENDLHCSRTVAFKLVTVASNKTLSNVSNSKHLPPAANTLYDLTVVGNKGYDLGAGIESGAIHPKMTAKDVKALLLPSVKAQRDDDPEEPNDMPTAEEADESHQNTLYDHACLIVNEEMSGETRQRFFAYLKRKYHVSYSQSPSQSRDKGLSA